MKRQAEVLLENVGKRLLLTINDKEKECYIASEAFCVRQEIEFIKNDLGVHCLVRADKEGDFNFSDIEKISRKIEGSTGIKVLYSKNIHCSRLQKEKDSKILKNRKKEEKKKAS